MDAEDVNDTGDSNDTGDHPDIKRRKLNNTKSKLIDRVKDLGLDATSYANAIERVHQVRDEKSQEWVDYLLKIPFHRYATTSVSRYSPKHKINKYFEHVVKTLDRAVYGMKSAKEEVLNYIAQFISTSESAGGSSGGGESYASPRILGICGSPGIGKTALIRRGFAQALDRPIECISMGGVRDSHFFTGHEFTYIGSRHGILVQSLMNMRVMNGIMFFDEVDKISNSNDGMDVQNMLIHITDPVQNHTFTDKYFAGITIDLSKVIFVFSFNDEKGIHPILRDRIHIVNIPDPTEQEKVVIGEKYLLREIDTNLGLSPDQYSISSDVIRTIVKQYCASQKGVRRLKQCLESILMKINTAQYLPDKYQKYKCLRECKLPFTITEAVVDELLKDMKPKEDKYLTSMYL